MSKVPVENPGADGVDLTKALLNLTRRRAPRAPVTFAPALAATPPTATILKAVGLSANPSIANGGTGYVVGDILTLVGGTGPYAASVQVTSVSGGAITGAAIVVPGVYTAAPASPASVTGGTGTGASLNVSFLNASASPIAGGQTINSGNAALLYNFAGFQNASGYASMVSYQGTEGDVWFWSDDPSPTMHLTGGNGKYALYVDGQNIASTPFSTDASGAVHTLIADFGGVRKARLFQLKGYNFGMYNVQIAATSSIWKPKLDEIGEYTYVFGDSYTFATGATIGYGFGHVLGELLGGPVICDGIGSQGYLSSGSNLFVTRLTNGFLTRTIPAKRLIIAYGYNDAGSSMSVLATNFNAGISAVRAAQPNLPIFIVGPWTPLGATTNLTTVKTTLQGLVSALNDPLTVFVDIENIINSANKSIYTGGDNTHPPAAGHAFLGARLSLLGRALIGQ